MLSNGMDMKKPHGVRGIGKGLVKRGVSWIQCFTGWTDSQVELLIVTGAVVAAKVFL